MKQPLAPILSAKKTKDRATIAIVLAILLHLLIAAIVYFTIFNKNPSAVIPLATPNESPVTTSAIEQKGSKFLATEQPLPAISQPSTFTVKNKDNTSRIDPETTMTNRTAATNIQVNSEQRSTKRAAQSSTLTTAANIPIENKYLTEDLVGSNTEQQTIGPDQSNNTEYKLNKTKEYHALEAEIEKDSEQLSQLIAEVKKRNQSQIQQHQTFEPNLQANTQSSIPANNALSIQTRPPLSSTTPIPNNQASAQAEYDKAAIEPMIVTK